MKGYKSELSISVLEIFIKISAEISFSYFLTIGYS